MTEQRISAESLPAAVSVVLSIAFWLVLGLAVTMFAVLALAPRVVESARLRQRLHANALDETRLSEEIGHLTKLVDALEQEPDFLRRIASSELGTASTQKLSIPLDERLGHDARIPLQSVNLEPPPLPAWIPVLEALSGPSPLRTRWLLAAAAFLAFAFLVLNDGFFQGAVGAVIVAALAAIGNRYRRRPAESACGPGQAPLNAIGDGRSRSSSAA